MEKNIYFVIKIKTLSYNYYIIQKSFCSLHQVLISQYNVNWKLFFSTRINAHISR
ncbi:hypothetical protein [Arsenophonus endosymbiont of Bemisia tabaci]|uniref:hypothetical protein n=1 Tax=Arsenophonus endosymbiont of Bemisia tabaci TaxID=536059 RepID=UPI0015F4476A|nr:hypothetical protein [Arsenophonus endosymbiont of Bemisia tabaci]